MNINYSLGNYENCNIKDKSIDLLLTDLPYGIINKSRNKWDSEIDLNVFWSFVEKKCKPTTAIISTAKNPFTAKLILSNEKMFRYSLVWEKSKATGWLDCKKMPLRAHEDIVVFYKKLPTYNPQMIEGDPYDKGSAVRDTLCYQKQTKAMRVKNDSGLRYPRSVLYFRTAESEGKWHPTQKPLELFEYLIKTYSNEGDLVFDPCMGSGTTGIAAKNTNRNFIGSEKDKEIFESALKRLEDFDRQKNTPKDQKRPKDKKDPIMNIFE